MSQVVPQVLGTGSFDHLAVHLNHDLVAISLNRLEEWQGGRHYGAGGRVGVYLLCTACHIGGAGHGHHHQGERVQISDINADLGPITEPVNRNSANSNMAHAGIDATSVGTDNFQIMRTVNSGDTIARLGGIRGAQYAVAG